MAQERADFDLYMLPAGNGDCLWMEYDSAGTRKRMLIDCGTESSWQALKQRIVRVPEEQRHIDLLVITHIDDDHIGGALPLLKHWRALGVTFGEIWFNDDERIVGIGLGVGEGIVLSRLLASDEHLRKAWNRSMHGEAIRAPDPRAGSMLPVYSFGELKLTVLSPTSRQLTRLKNKWSEVVAELAEKKVKNTRFQHKAERWLGSGPAAPEPVRRGSLDTSIPNGSSIAFLATYRNHTLLFGADAFAPTLLKSLTHLQPAHSTSCFKLSHHGSIANISAPLLQAAGTNHYLISTDGAVHYHPHEQTLNMLTAGDEPKTLHFNYRVPHVLEWIASHPAETGRNYAVEFVEDADYLVNLQ